jgi:acidic leucine-rich nuclear phosphoprotein 32 family protein A/C/D
MSLAEGIRRESGGRQPSEVESLCLDQSKCNDGLSSLEPFSALVTLSLQDAGITSLDTLPTLSTVITLKMSDNKIKGGLENLSKLPALVKLYLAGNQIATLEALEPLKALTSLDRLDLEGNPVTKLGDYREKVFSLLPNLRVLDGKDKEGEEVEDEEEDDEDDDDDDEEEGDEDDDEEGDDRPTKKAKTVKRSLCICTPRFLTWKELFLPVACLLRCCLTTIVCPHAERFRGRR